MSKGKIARNILIDEPTTQDFFHGKGHDRTAQALATAIKSFKLSDRAIGLDGPWGSGKSSVVAIAQKALNVGKGTTNFHFFTFDIWSSQGTSFRRSFLEHFIRWSKQEFPKKFSVLNEIDNEVRGKTKVINSSNKSVLDWYGIIILLFVPLLPIYYFWAKGFYDSAPEFGDFLSAQPMMLFYAFLLLTVVRAALRFCSYSSSDNECEQGAAKYGYRRLFQMALSQTLLISTRSFENQTVTEHIREVDPSDFEFQATFRRVLSVLQDDKNKLVIVLDNIDRLPKDEIDDYWALVRSVFSRGGTATKPKAAETITAIVPYDRHLIGASEVIPTDSKLNSTNRLPSIKSREIFSKTFDEILIVSPPVMSNSREFFQENMRKALPQYDNDDELVRVYLIFNQIILSENGKSTPRQILSFINELTGVYVLHEGRIGLATIAVFIAYQDDLELNPTKLTEKDFISERFRTIASDAGLERNLAALIFNVEPDLAFQILLDDQIRFASVNSTPEILGKLAGSHGFDLRVGEVIASSVREWRESGDFGKVISNYAELASNSALVGKAQYFDTLVAAFFDLEIIGSLEKDYAPFLKVFEITRRERIADITKHFISCIYSYLKHKPAEDIKDGQNLMKAIMAIHEAASRDGRLAPEVNFMPSFPPELQVSPVVFGIGQITHRSALAFKSLGVRSLGLSEESTYLADMALEAPEETLSALSEFQAAGLLKVPQWIQVGNAILNEFIVESDDYLDDVSDMLLLLREVWLNTPNNNRSELNVKITTDNINLFENLHASFADDENDVGLHAALAIFGQEMISGGYGASEENGEGYAWFNEIISGKKQIDDKTYTEVADLIIRSGLSGKWTEMGEEYQPNEFLSNVIRYIYLGSNVPNVSFEIFLTNYDYLRSVLGVDISKAIQKLGPRASSEKFTFVTFEKIPALLISDSYKYAEESWRNLHTRIDELFNGVTDSIWNQELNSPDIISKVLEKKLSTSGYLIEAAIFRATLERFVSEILNGTKQPGDFNYDLFFSAVDITFHPDMYRKVRESLVDVSAESLALAQAHFPKFLNSLVVGGDRISKAEKDSIIRNLLAPALEARNMQVVNYFMSLGSTKVREYVKSANDSTQKRIEGAEKTFHKGHGDYTYAQSVADLLHGKRKARNLFEALWGLGGREG